MLRPYIIHAAFLLPKPLEPVRQLWPPLSFVCEPRNQQRERLGVTGDPQRSGVHGVEPHVADQLSRDLLAPGFVPAIEEARPRDFTAGREDVEPHFARPG